MIIKKLWIKMILFCLLIFLGSMSAVYAQEPVGEDQTTQIVVASTGRLELTLKQLGYDSSQLNAQNNEDIFRFDLPGNFQITPTGNYFNLVTSHVQKTPDQTGSLQVSVNNRPLSVLTLTAQNATSNTVRIDLPDRLLQTGRTSIALNLDTGDSCAEAGSNMDVLVDETSALSFSYEQKPYPTNLALYPFPFTENTLLTIPTTIVLPDQPTSADLSAAATVAAGLGRWSGGAIELTAVQASQLSPEVRSNSHLIVIGQPDNNPLLENLKLPLAIDQSTLKPGQGVLQEVVSPWNDFRLVLVVSGLDVEGVSKASQTLNRQAHFLGMQGPVAIVVDLLPLPKPDAPQTASLTLASLGYEDMVSYGAAPSQYNFSFYLPPGWRLEDAPYFVLKFAHADILDPAQSILDVKLNNLPVGSTLLDDKNVNAGELTVTLPAQRLRTGRNRLQIGIEMNLPTGDKCTNAGDQRAWTVISSESEIFLPYQAINLSPDLELWPYPFSQGDGFDQTLLVLPDQPTPPLFNDVIQLATQLGSVSALDQIQARVAYASEVNQETQHNSHVILLGRPTENTLLREINSNLPQPFEADSDLLKPLAIDTVAFAPVPNQDAGLLEIVNSPWDENYSLLAITGTSEVGYRLAFQTLLAGNAELKGNLAVIKPAVDPLSSEPNQISTYSIDTRPPAPVEGESSLNSTLPDTELSRLANRWWK